MTQIYNDPAGGQESSIGSQARTDYFQKRALIEAQKEQYFGQLADVTSMPKNMGKKIKLNHYLPLLDDANINDQGIDAAGLTVTQEVTITITTGDGTQYLSVGEGANAAAALAAARIVAWRKIGEVAGLDLTQAANDTYAEVVGIVTGYTPAWTVGEGASVPESGNLYGSSKDIGTIVGKLPALTESGGRVNRVGHTRIELEGTIDKLGFFDEYTQESMDFDSDPELRNHIISTSVKAANEMTEDALQIDLLNGAGVIRYAGSAMTTSEITGVAADGVSVLTYTDLMRLSIDLDNNRCPKHTKIITGSRMVDTSVINAARIMYIGSELIPTFKRMEDLFGNQAFIEVQKYAAAGDTIVGEIGTLDQFRIVVVPEMMHWAGVGAVEGVNAGYRASGGRYDVFPALVVGSGSFTAIGFQTDGKTVKFKINHKKPGDGRITALDPYDEKGFYSIKWYYGTMILRPERLALIKCVAEL